MSKVKEITLREKVIQTVGVALMNHLDAESIDFTKEGFVLGFEDETFVIKTIQKKKEIHAEDLKGTLVLDSAIDLMNEESFDEGFDVEEMEESEELEAVGE